MKLRSFVFAVLIVLIINSCSSTPDIKGLWQTDFWDGAYIRVAPENKFYVYENVTKAENNDPSINSIYGFFEQNDQQCLVFSMFEDASSMQTALSGIFELATDDHIILTLDDRCKYGASKYWDPGVEEKELNLIKVD